MTRTSGQLWVDKRAGPTDQPPHYAAELEQLGYEVVLAVLESADVVIPSTALGSVGVEVKTASGLFSDLLTQRLYDQLRRLRESYDLPLLLLAGLYGERDGHLYIPGVSTEMSYYFMSMAELDIQLSGVAVLRCPVQREATALDKLAQHLYDVPTGLNRTAPPRPLGVFEDSQLQAMRFLMGLPGVGDKVAYGLLQGRSIGGALQTAVTVVGRRGDHIREFIASIPFPVEDSAAGTAPPLARPARRRVRKSRAAAP